MRRILKISLAGFSFILFLVALVAYLFLFTSVPERQLNALVSRYLQKKTGLTVTVERINRDVYRRLELEGVSVYIEQEGQPQLTRIARIRTVEAKYSLENILARSYRIENLRVDGLELAIPSGDSAAGLARSVGDAGRSALPAFSVERMSLEDIQLEFLVRGETVKVNVPVFGGSLESRADTLYLKVDSLRASSLQKELVVENVRGNVRYASGNLTIDSLQVMTSRSGVEFAGSISNLADPVFDLRYFLAPIDLKDIEALSGSALEGVFLASGEVKGRFDDLAGQISGDGNLFHKDIDGFEARFRYDGKTAQFDSFKGRVLGSTLAGKGFIDLSNKPTSYGYKGQVSGFNLQNIGTAIYSNFTGEIDLGGSGLNERDFGMTIAMDLSQADIDIYHFEKAQGEIQFDLHKLSFLPGFKANYKDTWVTFDGDVGYTGEVDIAGSAEFADLADFKNQFFITDLDGAGRAKFHVTGPTEDFHVEGSFESDSVRLYGLVADEMAVDVDLRSFISHKVGTIRGYWKGGTLYSVPIDSGYFSVLASGEKYFLERISCQNSDPASARLSLSGLFDNGTIPPSLTVDSARIVLWDDTIHTAEPLLVDVYEDRMEFRSFRLYSRSGTADMTGSVTFENEMNLRVFADSVNITPIMNYFVKDRTFSGTLSGTITAKGNFDYPRFAADMSLVNLAIDETGLGELYLKADYDSSVLQLHPAQLQDNGTQYTLSGTLPVNLSFTYEGSRLPEAPISLELSATGNTIALVPAFVPSIEGFDAGFKVDIAFSGTYNNPQVNGSFAATDGVVKVLELVNPISDVRIIGRMENDLVYVDSLHGLMRTSGNNWSFTRSRGDKNRGVITGKGTIRLLGLGIFDYDVSLSGNELDFITDSYDIQGTADVGIVVRGSSPPTVSGSANLTRFEMKEPFSTFATGVTEESEVLEDSTLWDLQLDVSATNNLWVKNAEADIELQGDLLLSRERGIYRTLGQLDVLRGNFYLWGMKFRVDQGQMVFNEISDINPAIDFEVTTTVRGSSVEDGQGPDYTDFTLFITGTLAQPQIRTPAGSEYSDEDILSVLLAGGQESVTPGGLADNLISNATGFLIKSFNPIERTGVIDEFDINPYNQEGALRATRISVAKYISPKLFLRYSRTLSQEAGQTFGIEYFFNNNLSFEGKQGTQGEGVSMDLKFRHDY